MQLHIFKDTEALSVGAAEWIIDLIQEKLKEKGIQLNIFFIYSSF